MPNDLTAVSRRVLGLALRLVITLAFVAVAVASVVLGRALISDRMDAVAAPEPAPLPTVVVKRFEPVDSYQVERVFTGQVEPRQRTELSFELSGSIAAISVDEGDRILAGQELAQLDRRLLEADRQRLTAGRAAILSQVEMAELNLDRRQKLLARGFATLKSVDDARLGLEELRNRVAELDASLLSVAIQLEKTAVSAPFDGTVVIRHVDIGGTASPGRPILTVVEDRRPTFRVGLPGSLARELQRSDPIAVTIANEPFQARYRRALSELDAETRTQTVLFDLLGDRRPPFRETGQLTLTQLVDQPGFWVPMAALEAGPQGLWRLLTVAQSDDRDGQTITTETVEVMTVAGERAFVRGGLSSTDLVVVDGAHRVVPGQAVQVTEQPSEQVDDNQLALN